jgi:hypothetical protein
LQLDVLDAARDSARDSSGARVDFAGEAELWAAEAQHAQVAAALQAVHAFHAQGLQVGTAQT